MSVKRSNQSSEQEQKDTKSWYLQLKIIKLKLHCNILIQNDPRWGLQRILDGILISFISIGELKFQPTILQYINLKDYMVIWFFIFILFFTDFTNPKSKGEDSHVLN